MATLLRYTGEQETVTPANPETGFSLGELYTLIGCEMIETVCLGDRIMVIDEEGKFRKDAARRFNFAGTLLLKNAGGMKDDWITGNALICDDKEFQ